MFVLYGITRFVLEAIRDDNPLEFAGMTISQVIGIALALLGVVLLTLIAFIKPSGQVVDSNA